MDWPYNYYIDSTEAKGAIRLAISSAADQELDR